MEVTTATAATIITIIITITFRHQITTNQSMRVTHGALIVAMMSSRSHSMNAERTKKVVVGKNEIYCVKLSKNLRKIDDEKKNE